MKSFENFTGIVAPLDRSHVDTDQIIPKQFLKRVERSGFGEFLFHDWCRNEDGSANPNFVLNLPRYEGAEILITQENFGCGSSREHAPWALLDYGFRVIIALSFADIFCNNCYKNGMLPIELPKEVIREWFERIDSSSGYSISVDLAQQTINGSDGYSSNFEIDEFRKHCLLHGHDDIALTLQLTDQISEYEDQHREAWQAEVSAS
jgi:3-isopropylmalate/(R)-2-methylmalate dehydratase small subunit